MPAHVPKDRIVVPLVVDFGGANGTVLVTCVVTAPGVSGEQVLEDQAGSAPVRATELLRFRTDLDDRRLPGLDMPGQSRQRQRLLGVLARRKDLDVLERRRRRVDDLEGRRRGLALRAGRQGERAPSPVEPEGPRGGSGLADDYIADDVGADRDQDHQHHRRRGRAETSLGWRRE